MAKFFWLLFAGLVAAAVHISYVLFVPGAALHNELAALSTPAEKSKWHIATDSEKSSLLPGFAGSGVAAICAFDLGQGPYELGMNVPKSYWSLAIYAETGKQVYSLNDKQAGAETFQIEVRKAKSMLDQLASVGEAENTVDVISNIAWTVEMADRRGVAVLWLPAADQFEQGTLVAQVQSSSCIRKKS
jgi:uncharacterized membrane protein